MRSFVADGNFKAVHLKQKDDDSDVWLTAGEGFMTNEPRYQMHLERAQESKSVSIQIAARSIAISINSLDSRPPHATAIERN
jgi:hypothetical protein